MAPFTAWLLPAALRRAALATGPAMPETILVSLVRFEGALAWEAGTPRSAGPPAAPGWVVPAWLEGWDWAHARYGGPD